MTPRPPSHMTVVKKENKEARLEDLLAAALASCPADDTGRLELRYLAQSPASPVARVVARFQARLEAHGIAVRALVARLDPPDERADDRTDDRPTVPPGCRHLTDTRCHDAHEVLILGTATAWVGDCLRRNPATNDSYELYIEHAPADAAPIARTFERLWTLAAPRPAATTSRQLDRIEALAARLGVLDPHIAAETRH